MNSSSEPLLTVIVAVFNCEKYIEVCLESLKQQQVKKGVEFICINDGSTDSSLEILESYASKDNRFKIFSKKNGGISSARNFGLDKCLGKYICFVDGDDKVGPHTITSGNELQLLLDEFEPGVSCVCGKVDIVYEANQNLKLSDSNYYRLPWRGKHQLAKEDFLSLHVSAWGKIYLKSVIDKEGLRFPPNLCYEDAYWHMCYAKLAPQFKFSTVTAYTYFRHPCGIMNETFNKKGGLKAFQHVQIGSEVFNFYKKFSDLPDYMFVLRKMFEQYFWFAMNHVNDYDKSYVVWATGNELRKLNFNTEGNEVLTSLKFGTFGEFQYDTETINDARKWRKLKQLAYRFLPKNSKLTNFIRDSIVKLIRK